MHLFEKASMESGFIEYDSDMVKEDYPLQLKLTELDFDRLKNKIKNQISFWLQEDRNRSFLKHQHAVEILFMWLRLDAEKARIALDAWIEDDRGVFDLLNTMMTTSYSYSVQTGGTRSYGLGMHGLKKLLGMDGFDIRERGEQAASNAPYISKDFPKVIRSVRELPDSLPG